MRHRLFSVLSAISLLLCAAMVVLWVRSYSLMEGFIIDGGERQQYGLASHRGTLWVSIVNLPRSSPNWYRRQPAGYWNVDAADVDLWSAAGISVGVIGFSHSSMVLSYATAEVITIPHWFVGAGLVILPGFWLKAALRRRRRKQFGLCPVCSYDLRATPQQCPECGHSLLGENRGQATHS